MITSGDACWLFQAPKLIMVARFASDVLEFTLNMEGNSPYAESKEFPIRCVADLEFFWQWTDF